MNTIEIMPLTPEWKPISYPYNTFSDSETWSLDWTIIKFILPRLRKFREVTDGYPTQFESLDEWKSILDCMISGFEAGVLAEDDDGERICLSDEEHCKVDESLKLLFKYFWCLWW